jgi:hypothetical protein
VDALRVPRLPPIVPGEDRPSTMLRTRLQTNVGYQGYVHPLNPNGLQAHRGRSSVCVNMSGKETEAMQKETG